MSAVAVMEATAETPAAEKMRTATDARTLAIAFMKKASSKCCLFTWILLQISIFIYVQIYANLAMQTNTSFRKNLLKNAYNPLLMRIVWIRSNSSHNNVSLILLVKIVINFIVVIVR